MVKTLQVGIYVKFFDFATQNEPDEAWEGVKILQHDSQVATVSNIDNSNRLMSFAEALFYFFDGFEVNVEVKLRNLLALFDYLTNHVIFFRGGLA